jgi:glutamate racemase
MESTHPIGIFDSGFGGLTVFKSIAELLPQYDFLYLGDNARAPYGNRSYETIYHYTLQCIEWFFNQGCNIVILACNTASAKALRTIQQHDLLPLGAHKRVLGVIRPTAEVIGQYTKTKCVGVLGTKGTINSQSYEMEIHKLYPDVTVYAEACPIWVPLVEYGEYETAGADYFVEKYISLFLKNAPNADTLLLACTHYPLLLQKIKKYLPPTVTALPQGDIVAASLKDYLARHPEIENIITRTGKKMFYTTDAPSDFDAHAAIFYGAEVRALQAILH